MTIQGNTIPGSYAMAKLVMPDGTEVPTLVEQVLMPDQTKRWVVVDERIKSFEQRWDDTDRKPHDLPPVSTEAVDRREATTITGQSPTRTHISAQLVRAIGDPDRVLAQKGLDPDKLELLKKNPREISLLRGMCRVAGGKWSQVLSYLPPTGF